MLIKILVVDDSASDRLIIKNMLGDYSVLTASDGVEAMRMLEEHEGINLMILDLNMPEMDGFQVLEALKADDRYKNLRTIILTNYDELDNEIKGLRQGAVDYIRKPIHMDSLKARIDIHAQLLHMQNLYENKLFEQGLMLDSIFYQSPIGIAISHNIDPFDTNSTIIASLNPMFEQIIGRTTEELIKVGWAKITHPDDLEEDAKNFNKLRSGQIQSYSMEKRYIKPNGSIVWVHMIVAHLNLTSNYQYNHICLVQDITERKAMEKTLTESERSKSVLLSNLPGLAYKCNYDRDWTVKYVSNGCFELTGYHPDSLLNNRDLSFNNIITPEYRELLWGAWEHALAKKSQFKYEYEITTASGARKWVLELGQGIYNEKDEVVALEGIILDISDRKEIENHLRYVNEHDRCTGLYNRDYLESLLENDLKLKENTKRALISINLSTVQLLTANYGFHYTQNLIKKAAVALSRHCTDKHMLFNTYVNRFVFYLIDYKNKSELIEFGQTIGNELEALFLMERIGGGIGVLEIDQDNEFSVDLLLKRLLVASEKSINVFEKDFSICFYDENLENLINREGAIRQELARVAVDNSLGELFLQYQPILDLKSNSICGFEALARLQTEKLGLVSPVEFIPIAEETKLIIPIGEKVIIEALSFLKRLIRLGYETITVSVNVSAIQLLRPEFTNGLLKLIREMRVNPANIGIEITESVFAHDYSIINSIISKLKKEGLHVAIDDFGTGYSSLAREKELNVNCLKIDKYFIDKLLESGAESSITGDIISMAHRLGNCTIAEGVEHEVQKQYLLAHGCDKIQGYLIGRPLDEEIAVELLKNQQNIKDGESFER